MMAIINEVTSHNGVLVWCSSHELLMRIKPSLDSSEVGAELMRKIVEVREGLDRRNVFYSHNRYEDYFAKGLFRRMTELFW
jgi:N-acetylglutamate synthase-like GNAT family acetyltransferase